ncbi:Hypothetical protein PHPALM_8960 [Phytophthora palmivora]|uniref:PiggyBac transposable element-derived protein domain-containing protein n=1 Tax=Phytophthora palmivora TaxID=4796 RepID=A0A2P4Y8I8_9STRA|nr:Hypothetical protein PHPALM_8960 [Phytophthora palmivora]
MTQYVHVSIARLTCICTYHDNVDSTNEKSRYSNLDNDGENDEGTGWDSDDLSGDGEPYVGIDEDGPPQPEMLFDESPLDDAGGMHHTTTGRLPADLLKTMAKTGWSDLSKQTPYDYLMEPYESRPTMSMWKDYPRLYNGDYGPAHEALAAAVTPSGSFFYFMQPSLWEQLAAASNDYFRQNKQPALEKKKPQFKVKEREKIKEEQNRIEDINVRELCVFIGILVARTVAPNMEKLENHWKKTDEGAIPRGCFGQFMVRDRFMHLSRNLYFSDNTDQRALIDRSWKIRPVITALQQRFQLGYTPPPTKAFDEAMLPSQPSFNRMRVFIKDKPHRWGTKLFMLCCSTTAYRIGYLIV